MLGLVLSSSTLYSSYHTIYLLSNLSHVSVESLVDALRMCVLTASGRVESREPEVPERRLRTLS